jgi:hypothetical protein
MIAILLTLRDSLVYINARKVDTNQTFSAAGIVLNIAPDQRLGMHQVIQGT